jgi:hypothetical protein
MMKHSNPDFPAIKMIRRSCRDGQSNRSLCGRQTRPNALRAVAEPKRNNERLFLTHIDQLCQVRRVLLSLDLERLPRDRRTGETSISRAIRRQTNIAIQACIHKRPIQSFPSFVARQRCAATRAVDFWKQLLRKAKRAKKPIRSRNSNRSVDRTGRQRIPKPRQIHSEKEEVGERPGGSR